MEGESLDRAYVWLEVGQVKGGSLVSGVSSGMVLILCIAKGRALPWYVCVCVCQGAGLGQGQSLWGMGNWSCL